MKVRLGCRHALRGIALAAGLCALGGTAALADEAGTAPAVASAAVDPAAAEPALDLAGTWRLDFYAASLAKIPVLGDTGVIMHSVMVAEVTREGDAWVQRHRVCGMEAESDRQLAETVIPAGFIEAMPRKRYTWKLSDDSATPDVSTDLGPIAIGWNPANSATGELPHDAQDPAVYDWDGDGQPGATVLLDVPLIGDVALYIVQYNHSRLSGKVVAPDRVEGTLFVAVMKQGTIGASNRLFARNAAARPDRPNSRFTMVKVADGTGCSAMGL